MNQAFYKARDLIEQGEDFVIAKIVDVQGSAPRKQGAWLLMQKDGTRFGTVGGGRVEAEAEKLALAAFMTKDARTHHFALHPGEEDSLDMRCGGDVDISIEYIEAAHAGNFLKEFQTESKAVIFGAGHVGLALEPVLRHIGFTTIVVDDRPDYANQERFPAAGEVKVIESFQSPLSGITLDKDSYIIIVTRGHAGDYDVLKACLDQPSAYIGMIGSRRKVAELYRILREEDGIAQEQLDRVYSPVGLSIHAETPEEIAVSIAAEMIQVRAGYGK